MYKQPERQKNTYQPIAIDNGGSEVGGPFLLAVLDLLFGAHLEILSKVHEHENGDGGAKALLHDVENSFCFHDDVVLKC